METTNSIDDVKKWSEDIRNKIQEENLINAIAALNNIIQDNEGFYLMYPQLYYMLTEDLKTYYLTKDIDNNRLPEKVTKIFHLKKKSDNIQKTVYDIFCYKTKEHVGIIEIGNALLNLKKLAINPN